jgi:hypothetical protein
MPELRRNDSARSLPKPSVINADAFDPVCGCCPKPPPAIIESPIGIKAVKRFISIASY